MVDLFALSYPALDDIRSEGVRSGILSHGVRPCWGVVDDTNIRAKELFGLFPARIVLGGHINDDGAILSHCGRCAGRRGIGAGKKGRGLDAAGAIPRGILAIIWKKFMEIKN